MSDRLGDKIEKLKSMNDPYWLALKLFKRLDDESHFWEKIGVSIITN